MGRGAGEVKVCVAACPSGYTYDASVLLCVAIPVPTPPTPTPNNTNTTSNTTTSDTTPSSSGWVSRLVPNYLFSFILIAMLIILGISKYHLPETNLKLSLFALLAVSCAACLVQILYF